MQLFNNIECLLQSDELIIGLKSKEDEELIFDSSLEILPHEELCQSIQGLIDMSHKTMKKRINETIKQYKLSGKLT